jgi:hypothetical protein
VIRFTPFRLILIGVALMVYAAVITFVMALRWIPSTFFLNFTAGVGSIVGMTLGLYGVFQMTRPKDY